MGAPILHALPPSTGWRNVVSSAGNGWSAPPSWLRIVRDGWLVRIEARGDISGQYGGQLLSLPAGFQPAAGLFGLPAIVNGQTMCALYVESNTLKNPSAAAGMLDFAITVRTLQPMPAPSSWPGTPL